MGDHVKKLLINLLWILLAVAVGGALLLTIFGFIGDFARGTSIGFINGSIIASQMGVSLGFFMTSVFSVVVRVLFLVAAVAVGALGIRWIISWVK